MKFKRLIITLLFSFTVSGCQQSKSYIVTWKNYDGSVLEVDENVSYGTIPSYDGITPTREDDEENTYIFSGWSPNVTFVNGNQTYTAQYVNGFLEFSLNDDNNSYSVACRFDFDSTSIEIPSTYLGKPVTSIGDEAFSECSSLTSIVIPSSVTSIDESAFWGCSSLTSINVSDDNNNYSSTDGVLYNKNKTTLINYPYGKLENIFVIPSSVTSIDEWAFSGCSSLTSIVIPNSVTVIGNYAFFYCSSLTSIVIPDSVTIIENNTFLNCSSLTSIVIPNGVTHIGNNAFLYCSSLTSIVIPTNVTHIGNNAFSYCSSLTSIVIPNNVTHIGNNAFSYCSSLTSIVIPDSVTSIDYRTFYNCSSLTSIDIPSSVITIGGDAFSYCSSLTSIVIPSSVTSIDESAFWGCSSLTSINVSDDNNNYSSIDGVLYNKNKTTLINYPYGKLENIFVIPSSVTSIGYGAFLYCSSLTSIVIPSSVTSIGRNAFSYCSSLTSIVIPDSVTSIGRNAFANCLSLTIYAEASSEPSGWDDNWNSSNRPVIWGYIG